MTTRTMTSTVQHPCRFTRQVLDEMRVLLNAEAKHLGLPKLAVIDPFAGTGERVAAHPTFTEHVWIGLELEESFIVEPWVMAGNALRIQFGDRSFHCYATSFVFPNRMTDTFVSPEADQSTRNTYSHKARANRGDRTYTLDDENAGGMRWGDTYREFHVKVIREGRRVLGKNGLFIVEMKNHLVGDEEIDVVGWFTAEFERQHCTIERVTPIAARGNRNGTNGNKRVDHTNLICARVETP